MERYDHSSPFTSWLDTGLILWPEDHARLEKALGDLAELWGRVRTLEEHLKLAKAVRPLTPQKGDIG